MAVVVAVTAAVVADGIGNPLNQDHSKMRTLHWTKLSTALTTAGFLLAAAIGGANAQQQSTLTDFVAQDDPPIFDQAGQAVDAFKAALAANDFDGLARLLGLDAAKLKASEGVEDTFAQMREGAAKQVVVEDKGDQQFIELGKQLWPVPFPIVKGDDGKWAFDTVAGIEEIVNRRVGENEIEALATARAYVEAQEDYFSADHDADGVLEYAQKLISTEGLTDGLYWPADQGDSDSPAGAIPDEGRLDEAKAQLEKARNDQGYYGYRFRILTGQGDKVVGGKYDYVINDNMIAGFALVAWPVTYAETGVKTFIVSKDGIVYEADLGVDTDALAKAIQSFNPDDAWEITTD